MTTRAEWIALAERCEAAAGPDYLLNLAVHRARTGLRISTAHWSTKTLCDVFGIPPYTSSLDAAVALVEGEFGRILWRAGNLVSGKGFAFIGTNLTEHVAATPALGLMAAFCKAKAETTND